MTTDLQWYLLTGVNPEPWVASEGNIGKRGGKTFIHFHKPESLRQYQESIKSMFVEQNPHAVKRQGELSLIFYFWRQIEVYETDEGSRNKRQSNFADATNLQKAVEDALQGILYENDKLNLSVKSFIVEQSLETTPAILIGIGGVDAQEAEEAKEVAELLWPDVKPAPSNFRQITPEDVF